MYKVPIVIAKFLTFSYIYFKFLILDLGTGMNFINWSDTVRILPVDLTSLGP